MGPNPFLPANGAWTVSPFHAVRTAPPAGFPTDAIYAEERLARERVPFQDHRALAVADPDYVESEPQEGIGIAIAIHIGDADFTHGRRVAAPQSCGLRIDLGGIEIRGAEHCHRDEPVRFRVGVTAARQVHLDTNAPRLRRARGE